MSRLQCTAAALAPSISVALDSVHEGFLTHLVSPALPENVAVLHQLLHVLPQLTLQKVTVKMFGQAKASLCCMFPV